MKIKVEKMEWWPVWSIQWQEDATMDPGAVEIEVSVEHWLRWRKAEAEFNIMQDQLRVVVEAAKAKVVNKKPAPVRAGDYAGRPEVAVRERHLFHPLTFGDGRETKRCRECSRLEHEHLNAEELDLQAVREHLGVFEAIVDELGGKIAKVKREGA